MIKLAVFDFDSTLMDGETIEFLARELNLEKEVAKITSKAMNGELDFFSSLVSRVSLLKGFETSKVNKICHNLPFMPGAKETISELKKAGITVLCFSGGFKNATEHAKGLLGYDADFSNILHSKDGVLTGLVGGEMMFSSSKGDMLKKMQDVLKITPQQTMAVGDGANDLSMFAYSSLKVAFCAKEILKKASDIAIDEKNLTKILEKITL